MDEGGDAVGISEELGAQSLGSLFAVVIERRKSFLLDSDLVVPVEIQGQK